MIDPGILMSINLKTSLILAVLPPAISTMADTTQVSDSSFWKQKNLRNMHMSKSGQDINIIPMIPNAPLMIYNPRMITETLMYCT